MIRFPEPAAVSLSPLQAADAGGRGLFRVNVVIPCRFVIGAIDVLFFEIPIGFVTDGGSFPRPLRWRFDPWGPYALAYVLHDALFYLTSWPKWLVDALFLIALRALGCGATEATLIYFGARMRPRRASDAALWA